MYKLSNFAVLISYFCLSQGLVRDRPCPENMNPVDNFNLKAFSSGVWQAIARYPNEIETSNCGAFDILPEGAKAKIRFLGFTNVPKDSPNYIEDVFEIAPEAGSKGTLRHEITSGNPRVTTHMYEYILAIDYDKYFISYECTHDEKTNTTKEYAWIVTRSKDFDSNVKAAIDNHIKSSKILDASKFQYFDLQDKSCKAK